MLYAPQFASSFMMVVAATSADMFDCYMRPDCASSEVKPGFRVYGATMVNPILKPLMRRAVVSAPLTPLEREALDWWQERHDLARLARDRGVTRQAVSSALKRAMRKIHAEVGKC